jgi:hypothetical protein
MLIFFFDIQLAFGKKKNYFAWKVCVCFESHKQFISYLAAVTIANDRAANKFRPMLNYGF